MTNCFVDDDLGGPTLPQVIRMVFPQGFTSQEEADVSGLFPKTRNVQDWHCLNNDLGSNPEDNQDC